MPKKSYTYLEVDPYKIIEKGFHRDRDQVSESLFSLGNEYSGIRGFLKKAIREKNLSEVILMESMIMLLKKLQMPIKA